MRAPGFFFIHGDQLGQACLASSVFRPTSTSGLELIIAIRQEKILLGVEWQRLVERDVGRDLQIVD